ncbi:MAG: hypothetical protein IPL53_13790 [Ignavibacteria bacterium]|nr:hypothetical protein [Ignavibacteria bacterium]
MKKPFAINLAILLLLLTVNLNAQQVTTEWAINNFSGFPVGVMLVLDQSNNVIVTGQSGDHTKIITTKYDTHGILIWERYYTIPEMAVVATWLSKDDSDNVIVTGYRHNFSSNPVESGLLTISMIIMETCFGTDSSLGHGHLQFDQLLIRREIYMSREERGNTLLHMISLPLNMPPTGHSYGWILLIRTEDFIHRPAWILTNQIIYSLPEAVKAAG